MKLKKGLDSRLGPAQKEALLGNLAATALAAGKPDVAKDAIRWDWMAGVVVDDLSVGACGPCNCGGRGVGLRALPLRSGIDDAVTRPVLTSPPRQCPSRPLPAGVWKSWRPERRRCRCCRPPRWLATASWPRRGRCSRARQQQVGLKCCYLGGGVVCVALPQHFWHWTWV